MFRLSLLTALAAAGLALPASALPSCYMTQADGSMVDLSHMCGVGGGSGGSLNVALPAVTSVLAPPVNFGADVWTRNFLFTNDLLWNGSTYISTNTITGDVYNGGSTMVEDVVVEATGFAEGRSAQTRRETISSIGPDDFASVTFDFGFSIPPNSWDIRIVEQD